MSADVRVRQLAPDELAAYQATKTIAYLEDPRISPALEGWWQRTYVPGRSWCAADGAEIVATLRTIDRWLSVPGPDAGSVDIEIDALTGVSVAATHRRRGLLTEMLNGSLAAAHERGVPVSALVAAQWPIYGRFGYWPAAQWVAGHVDRRRAGARLLAPGSGRLRRVDAAELAALAPPIHATARTARAGHIDRPDLYWQRVTDPELAPAGAQLPVNIVHTGEDGVDGYLRWRPSEEATLNRGGTVHVDDLFATNQDAYRALWGYALGLDLVDRVTFDDRAPDEPLPLLLADGRTWQVREVTDALWLRLLDVPAALSARSYAGEGRLVLDIVDEAVGGYATGRYLLEATGQGAQCRRAPELTADLAMTQRALAAVYLGLPSLRGQHSAGLVDELSPGALTRADALFATALMPWVGTRF